MDETNYPDIGDIWVDDEGEYLLFLTNPYYLEDYIYATVFSLNKDATHRRAFATSLDGGLPPWYKKVA